MGFATFVLKGLHPAAAFAWKLAKLGKKLGKNTNPLSRLELVAVFGLDALKPQVALVYFVGRVVVDKLRAGAWAKSMDKYLEITSPDTEITVEQVDGAFAATKNNHAPSELKAKAGFLYLSQTLGKLKAGDASVKARYCKLPGGRFDHTAALADFSGTESARKLVSALGKYDVHTLTDTVRITVLLPLADQALAEIKGKLREDIVDLLLV